MQPLSAEPAGFDCATPARLVEGQPTVYIVAPGGVMEAGGMGRLMAYMAAWWLEAGRGPSFRFIDPYGPNRTALSPFYLTRALWQILLAGLARRVDLLHVHIASKGSLPRKALVLGLARLLGLPVILHLHQPRLLDQIESLPAPLRALFKALLRGARRYVVLGEGLKARLAAVLAIAPGRVVALNNAVAGPRDLPARKGEGPVRLLFLGRLEPGKGLDSLLRALARPEMAALSWRATCAGPGPRERYRAMARELGLEGKVEILGWQGEAAVRDLLAEADVFVLPSRVEGLSIAMLEAMSFGLAVVASASGAAADAIEAGETGLLVPPDDPPALAAQLARLVAEPDWRARLQAGARRRFEERFEIGDYCERVERLYRETLSELRKGR